VEIKALLPCSKANNRPQAGVASVRDLAMALEFRRLEV